jgi:hypothetical protein
LGVRRGLFGLYPEANYGPNLDIYNGQILGFEVDGKRHLMVLKQLLDLNFGELTQLYFEIQ